MLLFKTIHKDKSTKARVGELHTPHGVVETPAFVPVGTQATVKSLTPEDLEKIGVQILFGNTYHLHLRPGEDVVEAFGGLGKFMHWDGVTMTDSGGFQVFSLGNRGKTQNHTQKSAENSVVPIQVLSSSAYIQHRDKKERTGLPEEAEASLVTVNEDGVVFKSHLDGSSHVFTPETSIAIQKKLGADIILAFDQCTTFPITHESAKSDMERTHRWAKRSLEAFRSGKGEGESVKKNTANPELHASRFTLNALPQALYGIVQGSIFQDLREESAKFIANQPFDGIAIGGVSVGESKGEMQKAVDWVVPHLPDDKVRHLLGIGDVDDIFEIIERGMDTFDCVTPSRLGRVGHIFIHPPEGNMKNRFRYDLTKSSFALSKEPLDKNCNCSVCQNFTRGYIQHLFRARELLAYRLATYHNIYFIINLTKQIRGAILEGTFAQMKKQWVG